jgi:hypothetical protein
VWGFVHGDVIPVAVEFVVGESAFDFDPRKCAAAVVPKQSAELAAKPFVPLLKLTGHPCGEITCVSSGHDAHTAATLWRDHRFSAPGPGPPCGRPPTRGTSHR